jgi:hypothetical protein
LLALIGAMLMLSAFVIVPQFIDYTAARYSVQYINPEKETYCPGDDMKYSVTLSRDRVGPVEIVGSWCREIDGVCILSASTVSRANIAKALPVLTFTATRTIPNHPFLQAGEVWEYVHSNRMLGTDNSNMYRVGFTVAEGCDS